ncbi:MAG: 30S ribosomal protein S4e [Candidatus Bathyarchaeia archaeon]
MGKKGAPKRLKRLAAPALWPIPRRIHKWVVKPIPGPHSSEVSLPLQIVLRDILGLVGNTRETRFIVAKGGVQVDGRTVRERRFPLGIMDVITFPELKKFYRIIPFPGRGLVPYPIPPEEAFLKPRKVLRKVTQKGGDMMLGFHDGFNLLIKVSDPTRPYEDIYKVKDVLLFDLSSGKIVEKVPFKENVYALIIGGKNLGKHGKLISFTEGSVTSSGIAIIESKDGERYQTTLEYVFPIGVEKPLISLPEGSP